MAKQPNFIFIYMDDMGWTDLACTGSSFYETPNIDKLAAGGMRFTSAYAACPVCSPSRASYLSGRYPARLGLTDWIDNQGKLHPLKGKVVDAPYVKHLPRGEVSLAQAMAEGGYQTWHVGKWHLGDEEYAPTTFGFEVNVGGNHWGMPHNGYFSPWDLPHLSDGPEGEYLTDRLTDEAIRLVENSDGTPFYMSLCHYAVHTPIQAKAADIARFEEKARRLGLNAKPTILQGEAMPVCGREDVHVMRRLFQSDATYAAMIWNLDENIGRLMATLEAKGLTEDTVVVFTSDNGGLSTAEGSPTCNSPAAEGKGWMYEGGTRVPLLVHCPRLVAPGTICDAPATTPDFYPTFLELANLPPRPRQHCDGVSLAPLLSGGSLPERPIFWHYPHYGNQGGTPGASVRLGNLKLIRFFEDDSRELYDLAADLGEAHNLAAQHPEDAARLALLLDNWLAEVGAVLPQPNPDYPC